MTGQIDCKTCESGKEPTGDQKACVIIGEQANIYSERTSGLCGDDGDGESYIKTIEDCDDGAGVLGWSDITAQFAEIRYTNASNGCFLKDNVLELQIDVHVQIENIKCSSDRKCLCKIRC